MVEQKAVNDRLEDNSKVVGETCFCWSESGCHAIESKAGGLSLGVLNTKIKIDFIT